MATSASAARPACIRLHYASDPPSGLSPSSSHPSSFPTPDKERNTAWLQCSSGAIVIIVVIALLVVAYLFSRMSSSSNLTGLISGSERGHGQDHPPRWTRLRPAGLQTIQYLPFTQTTIGFKVTARTRTRSTSTSLPSPPSGGRLRRQVRSGKRFLGKPNTDQAIAVRREALVGSLALDHRTL